jgi:hypothetical protein
MIPEIVSTIKAMMTTNVVHPLQLNPFFLFSTIDASFFDLPSDAWIKGTLSGFPEHER